MLTVNIIAYQGTLSLYSVFKWYIYNFVYNFISNYSNLKLIRNLPICNYLKYGQLNLKLKYKCDLIMNLSKIELHNLKWNVIAFYEKWTSYSIFSPWKPLEVYSGSKINN